MQCSKRKGRPRFLATALAVGFVGQREGSRMRRREFIAGLGGVAAWPLAARAQQANRIRRVGVLMPYAEGDREAQARSEVLRETLERLGWTVGRNLEIEYRWGMGDFER